MADDTVHSIPGTNWTLTTELPPVKKWCCTHGHKWEAQNLCVYVTFRVLPGATLPISDADFCMLCAYDWMREHFGQVREDT